LGAGPGKEKCREEIFSYRVQSGDNLSVIASRFGISTKTIVWANDLKNNSLKEGQNLIILPVSGVFHIVKKDESVSGIAKTYKADGEDIIFCNEIEEGKIFTGDILIVPGGEMPASVAPDQRVSSAATGFILPLPRAGSYISQGLHWYNAIDIANNCGVPVYASASGTVQQTGYHPIGGNYVRILHNGGIVTYYGHLSRISVSRGQFISQGNIIGYVGNTGYTIGATGCHVHFEVRGAANPFRNFGRGYRF